MTRSERAQTASRRASRRGRAARRIAAGVLVAIALGAWLVPYDVAHFVAKQQTILLGRYTVGIFSGLALGSALLLYLAALLASQRRLRECAALTVLTLGSVALALTVVSYWSYAEIPPRYLRSSVKDVVADGALRERLTGSVLTRQPHLRWSTTRRDEPGPGRTYTRRAPGFPDRRILLTTDERGLRNPIGDGPADLVVAGDSFTEGSMVDDAQVFWVQIAQRSGLRVYNVAVSGLDPGEYLNQFAAFGLERHPRRALFTVYEGNDFKVAPPRDPVRKPAPGGLGRALGWLHGDSPLRGRLRNALVMALAPIGADRPLPRGSGLDEIPAAVETEAGTSYYALDPNQVLTLAQSDRFADSREWKGAQAAFEAIVALARERGVEPIFLFAPSKEHVILPLVRAQLSGEALRAFLALASRRKLPPAGELEAKVYASLDARELVMQSWCESRGVEFVSTTPWLRARAARGAQVYFTYDQHWTELGHATVAEELAPHLAMR